MGSSLTNELPTPAPHLGRRGSAGEGCPLHSPFGAGGSACLVIPSFATRDGQVIVDTSPITPELSIDSHGQGTHVKRLAMQTAIKGALYGVVQEHRDAPDLVSRLTAAVMEQLVAKGEAKQMREELADRHRALQYCAAQPECGEDEVTQLRADLGDHIGVDHAIYANGHVMAVRSDHGDPAQTATLRRETAHRAERYRACWPDAEVVTRTVCYGPWQAAADTAGYVRTASRKCPVGPSRSDRRIGAGPVGADRLEYNHPPPLSPPTRRKTP